LSLTGVELEVREEVRQLALPLAEEAGVELVDVEFGAHGARRVLRVLIDKPGGVTVGDCAAFSRRMSDCLEMNQTVPGRYDLEVSSPGVDRPLRTLEAVQRFAGQRASIALREPHEGRRNFEGELLAPEDGRAGVRVDEGGTYWFEWADVKSARLVVDPWGARRSRGRSE
jgi:ribosome maturation factor RimP